MCSFVALNIPRLLGIRIIFVVLCFFTLLYFFYFFSLSLGSVVLRVVLVDVWYLRSAELDSPRMNLGLYPRHPHYPVEMETCTVWQPYLSEVGVYA